MCHFVVSHQCVWFYGVERLSLLTSQLSHRGHAARPLFHPLGKWAPRIESVGAKVAAIVPSAAIFWVSAESEFGRTVVERAELLLERSQSLEKDMRLVSLFCLACLATNAFAWNFAVKYISNSLEMSAFGAQLIKEINTEILKYVAHAYLYLFFLSYSSHPAINF